MPNQTLPPDTNRTLSEIAAKLVRPPPVLPWMPKNLSHDDLVKRVDYVKNISRAIRPKRGKTANPLPIQLSDSILTYLISSINLLTAYLPEAKPEDIPNIISSQRAMAEILLTVQLREAKDGSETF